MKISLRIADPYLLVWASLLTVAGLVFIFDAGYPRSLASNQGPVPPEFKNQLLFLVGSLIVGGFCAIQKPKTWLKLSKLLWFLTLALLVIVWKFGTELNGARRWLTIGPITVQPAEFAKLTAILYLAAVFADRKPWPKNIKPRRDIWHWLDSIFTTKLKRAFPAMLIALAAVLITKEPDLGTGAVVAATGFMMFFRAQVSWKSILAAVLVACVGTWVMVRQEPYRMERIQNHIQRWSPKNVDDTSFQTVQSEMSMASGGLTGQGMGNGRAKHVIPATTTDFIYATVAEEFGLVGALSVLALAAAFVWRLFTAAAKAPSRFAMLVLFGFGAWIGIQTCVNVMMANGFLPAIGIPFPFLSSGGSSLLALWSAVGISQSVLSGPVLPKSPSDPYGNGSGQSKRSITPLLHHSISPSRTQSETSGAPGRV